MPHASATSSAPNPLAKPSKRLGQRKLDFNRLAQPPDRPAQVLQRLAHLLAAGADQRGGPLGLAGRQALGPLQLDCRGRQPVADAVVHFPRQPVAIFDHRQRFNPGGVCFKLAVLARMRSICHKPMAVTPARVR